MKALLLYIAIVGQLFAVGLADDTQGMATVSVATIVSIDGKAKVLPRGSIKKHTPKVGEALLTGDKLLTYANTKVLIELPDASKVILNENAELLFSSSENLRQESGEVYYRITKRIKSRGLKVETPFSIIGIKGTEFIVNFDNDGQIALNEGLVGITSPGADFELYAEKVLSDFEKFQQEEDAAFEAYKRKTEDEIAAYVKSFDLEANKMLTFTSSANCKEDCEKRVIEEAFTQEIIKRFKQYQEIIGE